MAARALEGNPYDGHTLQSTMDRIVATSGVEPEHVYCDMNYRGHDYEGECEIHVGRRRRGSIAKTLWRWMKRRAAIEPSIGHLKEERRMERCRLKGTLRGQGQRGPERGGHELLQAPRGPRSFVVVFAGSVRGALCPSFAPWNPRGDCRVDFFRID